MPTIFSHAIFASVAGKASIKKPVSAGFWILTAACAMIPDADVLLRAERGSMLAHRGFTHSVFFALLFGGLAAFTAHKLLKPEISFAKLFIFFSLATFSHPFLDMLTDGGSGVALFAPFSRERFFLPFRPIEVSPIGMGFFSARGLDVILSEIICVWLPAMAIFVLAAIIRKVWKKHKI
jgi:inner membrane protein